MNAFTKVTSIALSFPMLAMAQATSGNKPAAVFGVPDVASPAPATAPVALRVFLEAIGKPDARKPDRDRSLETARNCDAECPDIKLLINAGAVVYEVPLNQLEIGLDWERMKNASGYAIDKEGNFPSQYKEAGLTLSQNVNLDEDDPSNFLAARAALRLWKPISFAAYKAGQPTTQGIVAKSAHEPKKVE